MMVESPTLVVRSLIQSLKANPLDLSVYFQLAAAYASGGEHEKAQLTLHRVIEIDPVCLEAWVRLGTLHSHLAQWRDSVDAFEQACALAPLDAVSWTRYAAALIGAQDLGRARGVRNVLLEKFPERTESHLIAGHISRIEGRCDDAVASYLRALRIDPDHTDAIFNLVDLVTPDLSDPLTVRLENLRGTSLSQRDAANVAFSLARTYEKAGRTEQAFFLYEEANVSAAAMLRGHGNNYDPGRSEQDVARVIESFSADVFAAGLPSLDLGVRMVFIVGMPRSGTTLIERVLSSHSAVRAAGELPFMQDCLAKLHAYRELNGRRGSLRLDDAQERRLLVHLRDQYLDALFERDLDAEYVTDKLPANFSALGLIRVLFPEAIIVHCTRDAMATCWSLYSANLGTHLAYHTSLEHLAHYYTKVYSKLMRHWEGIFGPDIVNLSYDDLVVNFEPKVRELLKRCGLPWDEACLRFTENTGPVYTASMQQVRRHLNASSLSRWREFEQYLSPLSNGLREVP